jgi:peptide/nickel transport system substrate-binding protein
MGQDQLDASDCNKRLNGTGPFKLKSWRVNAGFVAEKNPDYWQTDADGNQLPYLDEIRFEGVESGPDRVRALQAGDYDVIHTSGPLQIEQIREDDGLTYVESDRYGEVTYNMLNGQKPPFNNENARKAIVYGLNRPAVNQARAHNIVTLAQGPFGPGNVGFLEDAGFPEYDAEAARAAVEAYEEETGQEFRFTYTHASDPETTATAELQQQMWGQVGIDVSLRPVGDQSQLINIAIGNDFQMVSWRNHPGADPDTQYVWWHCGNEPPAACDNPVNFGDWNDPEINRLLDQGRVTLDEEERVRIYEDLNREFAKKLWNVWGSYVIWSIASQPNVHGVLGPPLPDGSEPFEGLATGHPVLGMWVSD